MWGNVISETLIYVYYFSLLAVAHMFVCLNIFFMFTTYASFSSLYLFSIMSYLLKLTHNVKSFRLYLLLLNFVRNSTYEPRNPLISILTLSVVNLHSSHINIRIFIINIYYFFCREYSRYINNQQ